MNAPIAAATKAGTEPRVTIVFVPRERFGATRLSLESILRHTPQPYRLVVVDAGSPPPVRRYLRQVSAAEGFKLISVDRLLVPNRARNLALPHVDTEYVVFLDNDLIVYPGWLEALLDCADRTQAWVVGPVYLEGNDGSDRVHMAGGLAHIRLDQGRRCLVDQHLLAKRKLPEVRAELSMSPTELIEFHCVLVRRDVFDRLGPLDEDLLSLHEHIDLCLRVREAGGEVYLQPDAVVRYTFDGALRWSDARYIAIRWSDEWNRRSLAKFTAKWRIADDDPATPAAMQWANGHRRRLLRTWLRRWLPRPLRHGRVGWVALRLLELSSRRLALNVAEPRAGQSRARLVAAGS